jgi:hypothetical protein
MGNEKKRNEKKGKKETKRKEKKTKQTKTNEKRSVCACVKGEEGFLRMDEGFGCVSVFGRYFGVNISSRPT